MSPLSFLALWVAFTWAVPGEGQVVPAGSAVEVETRDGLTIRGTLYRPAESGEPVPAVVRIHQGFSDRSEWDALVPLLRAAGYVTLAYDIRGHGASDTLRSPMETLWDHPQRAPLDLEAVLAYLRGVRGVDANRIAVMGGSVGANLAAMSTFRFGVAAAVALSPNRPEVLGLSGVASPELHDVLYLAGSESREGEGLNAEWAWELAAETEGSTRVIVVQGSDAHGVGLFAARAGLWREVVEWLRLVLHGGTPAERFRRIHVELQQAAPANRRFIQEDDEERGRVRADVMVSPYPGPPSRASGSRSGTA